MHYWHKSQIFWINIRSAADFPKLANFNSTSNFNSNLGYTEDYQQTKCIFISPISTLGTLSNDDGNAKENVI